MHFKFGLFFVTSVLMPLNGIATEVISFKNANSYPTHIRTLASSCAACHGSQGNAVLGTIKYSSPSLAGLNADYFVAQMLSFKAEERSPLIMQRHAKGLTMDEISALGLYFASQKFSSQKSVIKVRLKPQLLNKNHAN